MTGNDGGGSEEREGARPMLTDDATGQTAWKDGKQYLEDW